MKHLTATYRPIFRYGISRIQRLLAVFVLLLGLSQQALAQQFVIPLYDNENQKENQNGTLMVGVDNVLLTECGTDELGFTMSFALLGGTLPRQQRVFIIPQLMLDDEVANFPAIEIMGSWAYYHDIRTPQDTLHVPDTLQYRDREAQNYQVYQQTVARQQWMGVALLRLLVVRTDGCGTELNHEERVLRVPTPIITDSNANKVVQVNNIQQLRGRAYLSYPVRVTEVEPDYLNNRYELERLRNTIDSVSNDSTIEILRIQVKGYASPDGSYELNDRLARERTGSLARYIIEHTNVAPKLFHTSSEPEDWQGLRNFVDSTSLVAHRDSLLLLIDSDMDPDDKLHRIAATWPDDYRTLKDEAFPLLRHTDYQIDYQLKEVKEEALEAKLDTTYLLITDSLSQTLVSTQKRFTGYKPLLAVKTNMLYDLALAPNIEVEVPFGRNRRWSVMAEYLNPWWRLDKLNYAYEIQEAGVELRRWLTPRCDGSRPWLSGLFAGLYVASAKYDLEYNGVGDQGEVWSVGATIGYSWPLGRRWNLELSASAGYLKGNRRHYNAEFESSHLIYKETKTLQYVGPTKVKLSLVWIIPSKKKTTE
jgi:hypothetical protein